MIGERDDLASAIEAIDDAVHRVELERDAQAVFLDDFARGAKIGGGFLDRATVLPRSDHDHLAAERVRIGAGFLEHAEKTLTLIALCEYQPVFGADYSDFHATIAHECQHLLVGHALFETAREIDTAQLDRVPAAVARGAQCVG